MLKGDARLVLQAAAATQKAVDFILNSSPKLAQESEFLLAVKPSKAVRPHCEVEATMKHSEKIAPFAAVITVLSTVACYLPLGFAAAAGAAGLGMVLEPLRYNSRRLTIAQTQESPIPAPQRYPQEAHDGVVA